MKVKLFLLCALTALISNSVLASRIFIPMDSVGQANHLKAYGIAYAALQKGIKVDWLLNYKGGSFCMDNDPDIAQMCSNRNVSYKKISNKEYAQIEKEINAADFNGQIVQLEKAPKIAVYTPPNKEPWDDAVTMALTYAEIPFDKLYADEVLAGGLDKYDWLHLHHEDFTGQYGKFWSQFHNTQWYQNDQKTMEALAAKNGYKKVSQMQLALVKKIRDFVAGGGNMFAMCSATQTFDVALAADGVDICDAPFDGDAMDINAQKKLNFNNCFAFKDFTIVTNPYEYLISNIDNTPFRHVPQVSDNFSIVSPPGKLDAVPLMLCQNHVQTIKGFMGQTTAFRKDVIKPDVMILGDHVQAAAQPTIENNSVSDNYYRQDYEARYIHGEYGKGTWTFLGGHDPEDYEHHVGDAPTDLSKYPNSPGYRLILNNVLFPAAKKTEVPTVVINPSAQRNDSTTKDAATIPGSIKIYPNPSNDDLVISMPGGIINNVSIMNIAGQEVIHQSYNAGEVSIYMKDLQPGLYLVKVNNEYAGRVVKQ